MTRERIAENEIDRLLRVEGELRAEIERLTRERDRLRTLLDDKEYVRAKADYNRGHLSHCNYLEAKERAALEPKP